MSCGTEKMPELTAGKVSDFQPRSCARRKAFLSVCTSLFSSSPTPKRGPTAWMTPLKGSRPAVVTTASPTGMRPWARIRCRHSWSSSLPAACRMAAATPPPCASSPLAALTMHSTGSWSRSLMTTSNAAAPKVSLPMVAAAISAAQRNTLCAPAQARPGPVPGRGRGRRGAFLTPRRRFLGLHRAGGAVASAVEFEHRTCIGRFSRRHRFPLWRFEAN